METTELKKMSFFQPMTMLLALLAEAEIRTIVNKLGKRFEFEIENGNFGMHLCFKTKWINSSAKSAPSPSTAMFTPLPKSWGNT